MAKNDSHTSDNLRLVANSTPLGMTVPEISVSMEKDAVIFACSSLWVESSAVLSRFVAFLS